MENPPNPRHFSPLPDGTHLPLCFRRLNSTNADPMRSKIRAPILAPSSSFLTSRNTETHQRSRCNRGSGAGAAGKGDYRHPSLELNNPGPDNPPTLVQTDAEHVQIHTETTPVAERVFKGFSRHLCSWLGNKVLCCQSS